MKAKEHFKHLQIAQPVVRVDKETGVIKDVVILQEGLDKNGGFFTPAFLNDLIDAGNAQEKGVKSRFGHPNMCKTTLGSFIGRYKNFRACGDDEQYKVIADLHLDPITKNTQVEGKGISMYDYLLEMADRNADTFGNSIHFTAGLEVEKQEVEGQEVTVEKYLFESLIASDLVDTPAATDSLFKSSGDLGILASRFLDENPQVFEALEKDASILDDFLKRYANHLKFKKKMNILTRTKKLLGMVKDIDLTLADGTIVTVMTDAEQPAVGDPVEDSQGNPIGDGDHLLPDGRTLVTARGAITEIKQPETSQASSSEGVAESLRRELEEQKKEAEQQKQALGLITEQLVELKKAFAEHKRLVKSAPYRVPSAEATEKAYEKGASSDAKSLYSKIKETLENRKSQEK